MGDTARREVVELRQVPWMRRNRHLIPRLWWVRYWRDGPWAVRAFVVEPLRGWKRSRVRPQG